MGGTYRSDVDHRAGNGPGWLRRHKLQDRQRQKGGPAKIHPHHPIEVLWLETHHIAAGDGAYAGVVNKAINLSRVLTDRRDPGLVDGDIANVALEIRHLAAIRAQPVGCAVIYPNVGDIQIKAVRGEFGRDRVSDATSGS